MKAAAHVEKSESPASATKAAEPPKPRLAERPFVIQRKCACGGGGDACECDEKKNVQRKAKGSASRERVPREVEETLERPGLPLPDDLREEMERRFDHDFAAVRVHVDAESARSINARAYTSGTDIVFDDDASVRDPRLLAHELAHVVQQRSARFAAERPISAPDDLHEREADAVANRVVSGAEAGPVAPAPPVIARQAEEETPEEAPAEESARSAGAGGAPPPQIVDDDANEVGATQMRKTEFLDAVSAAACETADAELARVGRSTEGCPYVERAMGYYRRQTAARVESAVRRYTPGAEGVTSARDYIPLVAARIGQGVARWASTGEISDIPPELASQMPAIGLPEMIGAGLRAVGSFIGRLFGKAGGGASVPSFDGRASAAAQLGGAPLDGGVRTRMERAFGSSFAQVRVHTGGEAASAATRIGARAYTVGSDIAFARGEYQPGTPVGDALLAHELAHVVQQQGATTIAHGNDGAYEEDADTAAVGAMVSMWGNARGTLRELASKAGPRMRSGLRLSRCGGSSHATRTTTPAAAGAGAAAPRTAAPTGGGCGDPIVPNATTTENHMGEVNVSGFGQTSKLGAYPQFGAHREGETWHFCLTSIEIPVKSAVRPEGFRTEVSDARADVVTATTWTAIVRDLLPTRSVDQDVGCGPERFTDHVPSYSWRRTYWKRQLVIDHEAFHRTDWLDYYKRELIPAEEQVRAHTLPASEASTAAAAVSHERERLQGYITPTYLATCRAYAPQQETRAYNHGAPDYQALVDAIRQRAAAEGWSGSGGTAPP